MGGVFDDTCGNDGTEIGFIEKFLGMYGRKIRSLMICFELFGINFALFKVLFEKQSAPESLHLPSRHRRQKTCDNVDNYRRIGFAEKHRVKNYRQRQTDNRRQQIQKRIRFQMLFRRSFLFFEIIKIRQKTTALTAISTCQAVIAVKKPATT